MLANTISRIENLFVRIGSTGINWLSQSLMSNPCIALSLLWVRHSDEQQVLRNITTTTKTICTKSGSSCQWLPMLSTICIPVFHTEFEVLLQGNRTSSIFADEVVVFMDNVRCCCSISVTFELHCTRSAVQEE